MLTVTKLWCGCSPHNLWPSSPVDTTTSCTWSAVTTNRCPLITSDCQLTINHYQALSAVKLRHFFASYQSSSTSCQPLPKHFTNWLLVVFVHWSTTYWPPLTSQVTQPLWITSGWIMNQLSPIIIHLTTDSPSLTNHYQPLNHRFTIII